MNKFHFGFFLSVMALLLPFGSRAQISRSWMEGPLTWNDFQLAGPEQADDPATSRASFSLMRENKVVKAGGITYKYQDVWATISPLQSWVKPGWQHADTLRQRQLEFDILQYFANRYREDYMFYDDLRVDRYEMYFEEVKHKLSESEYLAQYREALESFRKTGDASAWSVSREPFDITKYPVKIAPGASEGLFSLFTVVPVGDLGRLFGPIVGLSAGYGYQEGRSLFSAEFAVATSVAFTGSGTPGVGAFYINATYLSFMARYGYRLFSAGKVDFSLFAGLGYSSWKPGSIMDKPVANGFTLSEGLRVDIPLRRTFNYLAKSPRVQDMGLLVRLYADEMLVSRTKIFAPTINLSVGLNFGFRKLSRM